MTPFIRQRGRFAARIAALHFAISLLVAASLALLVFFLWYPDPYRALMGSFRLFSLVVAVDVCCGPLLTFVLSSPAKKPRERRLDYSLVALIQLGALAYGLHGVYLSLNSPRSTGWTAILNADREMIAAAPVDAFSASPAGKEER